MSGNYREMLNQKQGQLKQIEKNITHYKSGLETYQKQKDDLEQAQWIIQTTATQTQEQLRFHIENLVSLCLSTVFDDPYELEVDMQLRRNQTEIDLWFVRDGEKSEPLTSTGGGSVDVAAFGLRIALWSLQPVKTRPIFILDEPMKNVSKIYREKCSTMMKAVADKLGLQIICVTHSEELTEEADKIIEIYRKRKVSYVK